MRDTLCLTASSPILIVDDDPSIRELIVAVLTAEGFTVSTAANGQEALRQIALQRPRLVLLDLNMPVMTGWEVLTALQEAQAGIPVVLMTAAARAQAEAERHQADGALAKPFELEELLTLVGRFAGTPG